MKLTGGIQPQTTTAAASAPPASSAARSAPQASAPVNPLVFAGTYVPSPQKDEALVRTAFNSARDYWSDVTQRKLTPQVVIASNAKTPCGEMSRDDDMFQCSADDKVYVHTNFMSVANKAIGVNSTLAMAALVSHEVAHGVAHGRSNGFSGNLQGNAKRIAAARLDIAAASSIKDGSRAIAIAQELQADCMAGVWSRNVIDEQVKGGRKDFDNINEELSNAAYAFWRLGDDVLQQAKYGKVDPSTYGHGEGVQRMAAFIKGANAGSVDACTVLGGRDTKLVKIGSSR